jgi:UDP-N-acetylmuramoyl-tripeptide--D-alanyl-D-alanine ligase
VTAAVGFWTLDRVGAALARELTGARPVGPQILRTINTDTRALAAGDCFVALRGEHFDAHDFLTGAVAAGAAALVIDRPERAAGLGVPVFVVRDTLRALGALAHFRRRAWGGPVIGVGGSAGKTTTKELLAAALGARLEVHATSGNFNNLVGVPLTLLAMPDHSDVAVVEMGMNVPGEMARLRDIAAPDMVVVTCVAEEHLEGLGSLDGVMREESLLFDGAAVAITPASQPEVGAAAAGRSRRVVQAGLDSGDVRAERWSVEPEGLGTIEIEGVTVRPAARGAHNLRNAMLALAAARECGVSMADAARGMAGAVSPKMRVSWEPLGAAAVINDAYNASPASMRAALDLLANAAGGRQRVAVLGGMRELGAHAARLHDEVARYALASPVEVIAGIGELGDALRAAGRDDPRVLTGRDVDDLWPALQTRLAPNAVILLKASRGVKLERLLPHLTAWSVR